ncbi:MAG: family 16 glycoside hydrolase, partial [Verrucomicrobiota bacterium]
MNLKLLVTALILGIALPAAAQDGFQSLFNGKDLEGWEGNPEIWSVVDGAITGRTTGPEQLKHNQFLIWRGGKLKNFELRAKIRVTGNNSGIQYRSKERPDIGEWAISGYQCDVHPTPKNNAMMYHEKGRGIVALNGQSVITDPEGGKWLVKEREPVAVDTAKFQEYKIIAKGNHLQHFVNGKLTAELHDHDKNDPGMALEGLLAFQAHRGPKMEVQIKDVQLKNLPDGGATPFEKADVPPDAQKIEKPAPKGKKKAPAPKKKATPKKKGTVMAPASGENSATPVDRIKAPEGFEVELVYSVPGPKQGSWVALCNDDKGRIYASDQYGVLYRFTPPAAGAQLKESDVERVPVEIRAINGMCFAFGALYVGVNDYEKKIDSGLYRITDTDGDDQLDKAEKLRPMNARGDHGVHYVIPTPDGEALYLITGNNADLTEVTANSPVQPRWGEDHLLERMPDGRGHNRGRLAPGGIIYRVDPEGKNFVAIANGFRNIYGGAVNREGELFTYDADMEYDFNTPWYRPTRVNHVVSGGEYGWRHGAGKFPEFYVDNLPGTINIGPGSPTGTRFGYGAKFPAKYQDALYILDWSWGKIYACHLEESGASYTGTKEEFITVAPLPVTDMIIHPDGAMYFAIGGRRVQSGLYRVTYTGDDDTSPLPNKTTPPSAAMKLRRDLEALHGKDDPNTVAIAWPHLDHEDRYIAWAARIAIEHRPQAEWSKKARTAQEPGKRIAGLHALARVMGTDPEHRPEGFEVHAVSRDQIIDSLLQLDFAKLSQQDKLGYVRVMQIALNRFGDPDKARIDAIIAKLDPAFPADTFELNWLLCETLVHLQAPNTAAKGMALIAAAESQEPQMQYARSLRFLKTGWTPELRQQQLEWFITAANYRGGASFTKFIEFIRTDSLATFTDAEKKQHAELIAKKPERKSAIENVGAIFAGRT